MSDTQGFKSNNSGASLTGIAAAFGAQVSMNVGAGFAKHLFPLVGAYGVTAIRIVLAAMVVIALRGAWKRPVPRTLCPALVAYGLALGLMNLTIYQAFARIPIGIATGIEVMGPLAIVLLGSHRKRDFLWLGAAVTGLLLLLPLRAGDTLDPVGIAFACAAATCWAFYIVFGKNVADRLGGDAAGWGMLVAATLAMPIGLHEAGTAIFTPWILLMGLGIAILSSAIPYSLEMEAMRRLPSHVFGILLSASPAVAAMAGFVVLGERLSALQWLAIACIITASAGSALSASKRKKM